MENKKELIWKDTQTIAYLAKQGENIISVLNDNYQKMKAIDNCLNYTTVIAATFFHYRNLRMALTSPYPLVTLRLFECKNLSHPYFHCSA